MFDVLFQVLKYHVLSDGAVGCGKIPAAPISFANGEKFALHFVRGAALHQAYQVADRQFRRDRDEHMHVIG